MLDDWDVTADDEDDESNALYWCTSCCDNKATYNGLCDECREEDDI